MSRIGARKRREQIAETKAARRLLRELFAEGVPERVETLRVPIVEAPPPNAIDLRAEAKREHGRDLWIGAAIAGGLFLFVVLWGLLVSGCQAPNEQEIATVDVSALTIAGGVWLGLTLRDAFDGFCRGLVGAIVERRSSASRPPSA